MVLTSGGGSVATMRLIKVGCADYKRFRGVHEMDVDADLVAIVGPNEAGKTSFLDALAYLDESRELAPNETTRGLSGPDTRVWARYVLDDADRAALAAIPRAVSVRQMIVTKKPTGFTTRLEPDVTRDLGPRRKVAAELNRIRDLKAFRELPEESELVALLDAVQEILGSLDEDLEDEVCEQFNRLASELRGASNSPTVAKFADKLGELYEHEQATNPWTEAERILSRRRPRFLLLEEDARELHSSYSFDEPPNLALLNLLALAETTWQTLRDAAPDAGRIEGILNVANERLRQVFGVWGQFPLTVRLRVADDAVYVLANRADPGDFIGISERSSGLRQFVALRAHIASKAVGEQPVLLVDEADAHLHYDAQADLIEVLSTQREASKVIYTTHSAGCLPPDLGTGIRIILPAKAPDAAGDPQETDDSEIINWFWTERIGGTGFSPILVGMGASAFAFAATRRAVIGEGATDAILLPQLFREATGLTKLDFQVAPGLANVSLAAAAELDLVASRVVHLCDGDDGGVGIEKVLLKARIPQERILKLTDASGKALVLEDLLDAEVYLAAVNAEIARWYDNPPEMPAARLTATLRPRSVKKWCEAQTPAIEPPGRRSVAHRVLEQRMDNALLAAERRPLVAALHRQISELL